MRSILVIATAAIMVGASPTAASARHHKHVVPHPVMSKQVLDAQASSAPQTESLGGMRYYGGPKSPMWRGMR